MNSQARTGGQPPWSGGGHQQGPHDHQHGGHNAVHRGRGVPHGPPHHQPPHQQPTGRPHPPGVGPDEHGHNHHPAPENASSGKPGEAGPAPASAHAPTPVTKICDLRPYMRNVCCVFIVLEKGQPSEPTKPGEETRILQCLVADASAAILLSLVEAQGDLLQPGDIIRLSCGFCTLYKNNLVLTPGRYGVFERIGEFTMLFSETPNMSQLSWVADPQNPKNIIPLRTSGGSVPNNAPQQQQQDSVAQPGAGKKK